MAGRRHAEIAGAGFAGLAAAVALTERGWSVRVHEAAPTLRELGAGLFIWDNGLRILEAFGAYQDAVEGAHQAPFYETRRQGELIARTPFNGGGGRMLTLTRQHLYSAMKNAAEHAGIEIVTNSTIVDASAKGSLTTRGGQTFKADLVVGADGINSAVRTALRIPTERRIFDDGVIRLLADRPETMRAGSWDNVIDFWAAPEKALRILYVPCSKTDVYLSMMCPRANSAAAAVPVNKAIWRHAVPELAPILAGLGTQGRYNPYEMARAAVWSAGRVALVGDAVNAMPPTLGQGVGCAMMNALALAVALEESSSIEDALPAWEARERPLTDATQAESCHLAATRKLSEGTTISIEAEAFATAKHTPTGTRGAGARRRRRA